MIDDGKIRISCLKDDRGSAVRRSYSITLSARAAIVGRDRDAQCLCRLDVEGEFEQRRLDRREVGRLFIAPDCNKGMEMERLDAAGLRQVAGDALDLALIATAQFYDVAIGVAHDHRNVAASLKLTDP